MNDVQIVGGAWRVVPDEPPEGDLVLAWEIDGRRMQTGTDAGPHYWLRVHGLCDFRVARSLDRIDYFPDPGADPEAVELLIRGPLTAFRLALSGTCVLHASAVRPRFLPVGRAIAFVGSSGMGKSTLAALACREGAQLVADDLLALSSDLRPGWKSRASELRLRPAAWSLIDAPPASGWPARPTVDGRLALRPAVAPVASGELEAVVVPLLDRDATHMTVDVLEPAEALVTLGRFPRLATWYRGGPLATEFEGLGRLARAVPIFRAVLPWGPPFRAGMVTELCKEISRADLPVLAVA